MLNLLKKRRSIRKFLPHSLDMQQIGILKEALLRSPSSRNIQPWTFIFVENRDTLHQLSKCKKHGSGFLKAAALAVVVCGDEFHSDVWIEDCSIAALIAHLTAVSLGLGSCWLQVRRRQTADGRSSEEFVQELLGIPPTIRVEAIVGIGHPAEEKPPVAFRSLDFSKIKSERWNS